MNYDPIILSEEIEKKIIKDGKRFFGGFFIQERENVNAAVVHSSGCNVKCFYCCSMIRDYQEGMVTDINLKNNKNTGLKNGYYSPSEILNIFIFMAENQDKFGEGEALKKVTEFAIIDCETTIGMSYVIEFMELLYEYNKKSGTNYNFQLFTNGIYLGYYSEYISELAKYKEYLTVRFSIKAGNATSFAQRLDVGGEYYQYPFEAVKKCIEFGIDTYVAVLCDEKIMSRQEYGEIKELLIKNGYTKNIFEETLIMNVSCITRIREHLKRNPDFRLNFKFRDSIVLIYDGKDRNTEAISNKLNVGISRVLGKKQIVCSIEELNKQIAFQNNEFIGIKSLVYISNFGEEELSSIIAELSIGILDLFNEVIVLNLKNNFPDKIEVDETLVDEEKIKIKNFKDILKANDESSTLSPIDIVNAGTKLAYFWT